MRLNGNPTLRRVTKKAESGVYAVESSPASYGGIAWKSVLFCALTLIAAVGASFLLQSILANQNIEGYVALLIGIGAAALPMIVLSLIIAFVPTTASYLGMIYSLLQGMLLGVAVGSVEMIYPGLGLAALLATVIVFVVAVAAHNMIGTRISGKFLRGLIIASISLIAVQLIMWLLTLIMPSYAGLKALFWIQFAVSAVSVIWASFMLIIDINAIDSLVKFQADKKYEWIAAFSLVSTLVWLYLEILEFLVRIVAIFGRNK